MKSGNQLLIFILFFILKSMPGLSNENPKAWIRVNLLGYRPDSPKTAVWCSSKPGTVNEFLVRDVNTNRVVFKALAGKPFGAYGPFLETYRLDFSSFTTPGRYTVQVGETESPIFTIGDNVYHGGADFCLRYMRQQRTGFNPFLKDSCHTKDGYVLYGEKAGIPDSTFMDVVGGWHDASDYLQYSTTSANATYHLLAAYRDFPQVFTDRHKANGLAGRNGCVDVLDEARWGLAWLLKMHPQEEVMFNQIADDRDHIAMRIPHLDSQYGRGYQRPVYFITGEKQQRGKFLNNTTGTSSTAAKFSSAFALGSKIFSSSDTSFSQTLLQKSHSAYRFALKKPGVTQTVSVRSPYIYAEDNWVDDMELAAVFNNHLKDAIEYAKQEPHTPWLGADTAHHYQWYPFINLGHYELAKQLQGKDREVIIDYYRKGIEMVKNKADRNAFNRGVPFIWCSNNLTTAFAIQCFWYRQLTGDNQFELLEQANVDWLLGCNPWGTSMIYGLPAAGDMPEDPHSAFTYLKQFPIDGALVDGPVYTGIFKSLIGIQLNNPDEYAAFQSDLAVYHDDYGDYSTNEPTMDGTASLIYLLAAKHGEILNRFTVNQGGLVRGDITTKELALVFTGHEYLEGLPPIRKILKQNKIMAGFFLTGKAYNNRVARKSIAMLKADGHYLGPHSDNHLLYNDWKVRDSLLVSRDSAMQDLRNNYLKMEAQGIHEETKYFIPPYEWWNADVVSWCNEAGVQVISFTPGTGTNADYTSPQMGALYKSSDEIIKNLLEKEQQQGLNGSILLIHAGVGPQRSDKLYDRLNEIIRVLHQRGYKFVRIDEMFRRNRR